MKEGLSYSTLKSIAEIIKDTESDIDEIIQKSNLNEPIMMDIIISKRNMSYNKIKAEIKKFKRKVKNIEKGE